jgi:mono/diheme cytochrome c family protein
MFAARSRVRPVVSASVGLLLVAVATPTAAPAVSTPAQREVLDKYCVTCHNDKAKIGGLSLDAASVDLAKVSDRAEIWEKVDRKLRMGTMPPAGRPRPEAATYNTLASWIETELDRAAAATPNPGRTEAVHRLNRTEYQNAVRDLFALDIDASTMLPADDADQHGFDNIAEVLSVSPALLDRYLSAARKVGRLAIGRSTLAPSIETHTLPTLLFQDDRMSEDLPFGSRGGVALKHQFPADGEYTIKLKLSRTYVDCIKGIGQAHQIEVRLDGALVKLFKVGGEAKGKPAPASFCNNLAGDPEWEYYIHEADSGLQTRFVAQAGAHVVGVTFPREMWEQEGILQPAEHGFSLAIDEQPDGLPSIDSVTIAGPYNPTGKGDTPSRRRVFVCQPGKDPGSADACAKQILSTLAQRAYRRPVTAKDVDTLVGFYKAGRASKSRDGSFEAGVQAAIERMLVDPDFLFRIERDPSTIAPGSRYRLSDLELASRLSFFLWSSIPDDQLLDVAARGRLKTPAVFEQQVRRMLADPRSKALVDNFAGQWLVLRNIRTVAPDAEVYPDFDENLRDAFQQETELFFEAQLREDKGLLELLTANYSYLNERLARHYKVPNVYGSHFRKVMLDGQAHRGGLLSQGSVLTVTSYPNRTSPVLRGKWILSNILGTPPPPPPPNVPSLPDKGEGGKPASVRERLEQHRKNPVCAACHSQMDPLGFALENYDAIGAWRAKSEAGSAIDSSGVFPGGAPFEGPGGLRDVIMSHQKEFVGTVTEKLLAYALGRGVQYFDLPVVRKIVRDAAPSDYRWSAIVLGIVKSPAFQMRTAADRQAPLTASAAQQ